MSLNTYKYAEKLKVVLVLNTHTLGNPLPFQRSRRRIGDL
jgi:hypothetical protein